MKIRTPAQAEPGRSTRGILRDDHSPMTASASISTSISGDISALTCTIDVAGTDMAEELSMRLADFFPFGDVDDEHSRAHHILHGRTCLQQGRLDVLQGLNGLSASVAHADDFAVRAGGCSS